jgi:hypothetical protein
MCKHITVLLPNRPGELRRITSLLSAENVNILGYQLVSEGNIGIAHILADPHLHAYDVLRREFNFYCREREIIAVETHQTPGQLHQILLCLEDDQFNIENSYQAFLPSGEVLVVLEIIDPDLRKQAEDAIVAGGFKLVKKQPSTSGS